MLLIKFVFEMADGKIQTTFSHLKFRVLGSHFPLRSQTTLIEFTAKSPLKEYPLSQVRTAIDP